METLCTWARHHELMAALIVVGLILGTWCLLPSKPQRDDDEVWP